MASKKRPDGYWTKERCREEAMKYEYLCDFKKNSPSAFDKSRKNKWLDDFDWLKKKKTFKDTKPVGYWTKERVLEVARKYSSRNEFCEKDKTAYQKALKNGWLDECDWFISRYELYHKSRTIWTYEKYIEAANKCTNFGEFKEKYSGAVNAAYKNGWSTQFSHFRTPIPKEHTADDRLIYAYEDREHMAVYVGLTYRLTKRDYQHRRGIHKKGKIYYDCLYKHCEKYGIEIPKPIVKMEGLSAEDAQYYEGWYKDKYAENGWTILNVARTGVNRSSLGGRVRKWDDKEKCRKLAYECRNRTDFQHKYGGAYHTSKSNGWLEEFFPPEMKYKRQRAA